MKPAIVLIHGAWHSPEHYEDLVSQLKERGFENVVCPRLPSQTNTLPIPETATFAHDTKELHKHLTAYADSGHPTIVIMHSYGGVVGSNALNGVLWPQRQQANLPGGVVHLIYMCAMIIPAGTAMVTPFNGEIMPWLDEDKENGLQRMKDARHAFYGHVESDIEARKWLDKTVICPTSVLRAVQDFSPQEYTQRGEVDATYFICKGDQEFVAPIQEQMAGTLGERTTKVFSEAGHCCMIGYAEEIADVASKAWERSAPKFKTN